MKCICIVDVICAANGKKNDNREVFYVQSFSLNQNYATHANPIEPNEVMFSAVELYSRQNTKRIERRESFGFYLKYLQKG